jgi:hypothetical protein
MAYLFQHFFATIKTDKIGTPKECGWTLFYVLINNFVLLFLFLFVSSPPICVIFVTINKLYYIN